MTNRFKMAGVATGVFLMAAASASAATVNVVASSTQGAGNQAHIFGAGYTNYTNGGASWDNDPTWTAPPANEDGISQSPFNNTAADGTDYFSVIYEDSSGDPGEGTSSPATLTFGKTQTAFNILWGSIDSYNEIAFSNSSSGATESWSGADIINLGSLGGSPDNYEQVALVKFSDMSFDSVTFTSDAQNSFEFALAPVPLPAGGLLLLTALGGVAALRRKRKAA